MYAPNLRVGDVVVYRNGGEISHTGRIWSLDASGNPTLVHYPPCSEFYLSPDLWCNSSGGTGHESPASCSPNQLWVKVRNADSLPITTAALQAGRETFPTRRSY